MFLNAQGELCFRRYGAGSALSDGEESSLAGERAGTLSTRSHLKAVCCRKAGESYKEAGVGGLHHKTYKYSSAKSAACGFGTHASAQCESTKLGNNQKVTFQSSFLPYPSQAYPACLTAVKLRHEKQRLVG